MGITMKLYVVMGMFLHVSTLLATVSDDIDFKTTSIIHNEIEHMFGREDDASLPRENNSFNTLYAELSLDYDVNENFFLSLGAKGNGVIGEERYTTPMYLRTKMTSDDINRVLINEASINYDDGLFALTFGRQEVNFDWLTGSIDGALAMIGSDDDLSLRLFWFENYRHLQYNYYMQIDDINEKKGMYGSVAKANSYYVELTLYDYFVQDLRNISGADISLYFDNVGVNFSYTSAQALDLALYDYDESFLNVSLEYLYHRHYFELGFSQTGENGLLAMIQMGSFMFGQFYLNNQVDRENARNAYLKYIFAKEKWRFEFIGGQSQYDNNFVQIEHDLASNEADVYLKYQYNSYLGFDMGMMYMDVDERDPLQVDQALVMFNVVLRYENY
jgi:hypothetical protein